MELSNMSKIQIESCKENPTFAKDYKEFEVLGKVNDEEFEVTVSPWCGEYEYDKYPSCLGENDEPLQIAIGEYFEQHNVDVGVVRR